MEKINFVNDSEPDLSAEVLNKLQVNIESAIEALYPVGSVYMNLSDSTNPADLLGFGTWERIKDRFIYALGDEGNVGDTGGSETHSHTQNSTTGSTTLTVQQVPSHSHTMASGGAHKHTGISIDDTKISYNNGTSGTGYGISGESGKAYSNIVVGSTSSSHTHTINATGGGQGHTHTLSSTGTSSSLPPYMKAYMWKRVA